MLLDYSILRLRREELALRAKCGRDVRAPRNKLPFFVSGYACCAIIIRPLRGLIAKEHETLWLLLVDSDVIDFHSLRPDRLVDTMGATPSTANGKIENQVEWLVEWPLLVVGGCLGKALI